MKRAGHRSRLVGILGAARPKTRVFPSCTPPLQPEIGEGARRVLYGGTIFSAGFPPPRVRFGRLSPVIQTFPAYRTDYPFGTMWTRANEKALPTIPVNNPTKQIDFILFRPVPRWKVIEVRILDEAVASDHRAIFAVLELLPKQSTGARSQDRGGIP